MQIKRNILLNPGPATTTDTVKMAQVVPDICPREKEFASMMKQMREDLVRIVHGNLNKYTSVLFCGSGTVVMDVCINSLLPEGKKILIINNGTYSMRAVEICEYYNLPFINFECPIDELPDLDKVEQILKENQDISLVYTTHNETGTGIVNPVREIGSLAHKYGAVFIVDTISTYAMRPIDIEKDNIDFCMASAQKGLMAMTGLSFVIGNIELIRKSAAYPKRSYYCNLFMQYHFFETTGQMHFTPPVQTIYAARQALDEYFREGEEAKWNRHLEVFEAIHAGLDKLGFKDIIKRDIQAGLGVTVKYPDDENWSFEKVHDYCYERGFTIYPGKTSAQNTFRLCALGAITKEDIDDFFVVLYEALKVNNIQIPIHYACFISKTRTEILGGIDLKDETKCLHAGYQPKNAEPRVMPIVQSTTYVYDSTEEVAAVFDDPMKSLIYSRFGNPTVMAVEDKIAELEGGIGAMCTTSGQAAVLLSLLTICNAGDSFISTMEIYGGSVNLFSHTLRRLGIECIYIDKNATDEEIDAAFQSNTKAVFGETIANPALTVLDIERFAAIAHKHGVPLIIDNTFATPILCKPFEFGADIIVHSTSKYMDGHAVQIGGVIVDVQRGGDSDSRGLHPRQPD